MRHYTIKQICAKTQQQINMLRITPPHYTITQHFAKTTLYDNTTFFFDETTTIKHFAIKQRFVKTFVFMQ